MNRIATLFLLSLMIPGVGGASLAAQETKSAVSREEKPAVTYKLEFTLTELEEAARVNSRSYTLLLEEDAWGRMRIGTRVPISMGEGKGIQYMDVGFSLDCRLNQNKSGLRLETRLEVNSFAPIPPSDASSSREPVLRNMRSELAASIVPGKPILLSSVDELGSRRRFQLEVTAKRME